MNVELKSKQGSMSSQSADPDEADDEDNSDDVQLNIIKFNGDRSPVRHMVSRENSPLSPMKKRNVLGDSIDPGSSAKIKDGFAGINLKGTVDISTTNNLVSLTNHEGTFQKKDIIPANPILPKMVFNEMK
jgi:hypothetical protein